MNIISKLILDSSELNEIHNFINNKVKIISTEHIYELLEIMAYYNNSNIIFNIKLPVISNEIFTLYHIIPTPINGTLEIISKDFVLYNEDKIKFLDQKCREIERQYFCKTLIENENEINYNCIKNIFKNKNTTSCHLQDIGKEIDLLKPENNYLLLINSPQEEIISTCNNVTKHHKMNGTILIHFEDCNIKLNNIWYNSIANIHWDKVDFFKIPLQKINTIIPLSKKDEITLPKLNSYRFQNRKLIGELQLQTGIHHNVTYSSLGTMLILFIIFTIIFIQRKPTRITYVMEQINNEVPVSQHPKPLWPSLHSKEGGVIGTT